MKHFDLNKLIKLRQHFHKHAEVSFEEVETSKTLRQYLVDIGIQESNIKACAKTGLVVDIAGKGKALDGEQKIVAFRADMDALEMKETNEGLEYRTVTKGAHMCGHDGHMTCMLGGITHLIDNIDKLPANRTARILFQPAEERIGGAIVMVKEGCLEGVSEVWGLHNMPWDPVGGIFVKDGPMMSEVRQVCIEAFGKGGHSSLKSILNNPVLPLCEINVKIEQILEDEFKEWNNKDIIFSMPQLDSSTSANVFPDTATLKGTLRGFKEEILTKFFNRIKDVADEVAKKFGMKIEVTIPTHYPLLLNDKNLTDELKKIFSDKIKQGDLPSKASEDFGEFSNVVPGCFFFIGVGTKSGNSLHVSNYNFNDDVIEEASQIWFTIMQKRLDFTA